MSAARRTAARARETFAVLGAVLGGLFAAGCIASYQTVPWVDTQRYPAPMTLPPDLPPGSLDEFPPGPEVVLIVRHADPVAVRQAGRLQGQPMAFYDKRLRVPSGSWVQSGAGGRAEVLWPGGSSILLVGYGTGIVGSTSRNEPMFVFREHASARIDLASEARIELLGGAVLVADAGPITLERVEEDVVELRNQSEHPATVEFRDEILTLEPGEIVDLPLLSVGSRPEPAARAFERVGGPGFDVLHGPDVERDDGGGDGATAVRLAARGTSQVEALGVRVRLGDGERVTFSGLGRPVVAGPAPEDGAVEDSGAAEDEGDPRAAENDGAADPEAPERR